MGTSDSEHAGAPYLDVDPFEHEHRFILSRADIAAFFAAVGARASIELYDRTRPISYTRTTYLDTDDFSYLKSCDGPVARRLRVREYAVAMDPEQPPVLSGVCFLELKQNMGEARSKVRFSAAPEVLARIVASSGEIEEPDAPYEQLAALRAIQQELASARVCPRLTTWYRRTSLSADAGRIRITADEGLAFCRPCAIGAAGQPVGPKDVVAYGPGRILEVKYWGNRPDWLARALDGFRETSSFSKFRMGMLAIQSRDAAVERNVALPASTPLMSLAGENL